MWTASKYWKSLSIFFIEKFAHEWLCLSRKLQDATDVNIADKMAACTGPYVCEAAGASPMPPLTPLHIGAGTGRHYKMAAGHHLALDPLGTILPGDEPAGGRRPCVTQQPSSAEEHRLAA